MTYATEFPAFDAATLPVIPAHWQDQSWSNEACPFWLIGPDMGVYIDHADPALREWEAPTRFSVVEMQDGMHTQDGCNILIDTDDWKAVLALEYKARIGYDPFEDDADMTVETVAETLAEYAAEANA